MAQKITTVMIDDLTGEPGEDVESVGFALDGIEYEIDLSEPNATALRDALVHYIERARRTGRSNRARPARAAAARTNGHRPTVTARTNLEPAIDPKRAREWGRAQGFTVPERGRLPGDLTDAYRKHLASV